MNECIHEAGDGECLLGHPVCTPGTCEDGEPKTCYCIHEGTRPQGVFWGGCMRDYHWTCCGPDCNGLELPQRRARAKCHHRRRDTQSSYCQKGYRRCRPTSCKEYTDHASAVAEMLALDAAPVPPERNPDMQTPESDGPGQPDTVGADTGQESPVDAPRALDVPAGRADEARPDCQPEIRAVVIGLAGNSRHGKHPICVMECGTHIEGRCPRPCSVGTYREDMRRALERTTGNVILRPEDM